MIGLRQKCPVGSLKFGAARGGRLSRIGWWVKRCAAMLRRSDELRTMPINRYRREAIDEKPVEKAIKSPAFRPGYGRYSALKGGVLTSKEKDKKGVYLRN